MKYFFFKLSIYITIFILFGLVLSFIWDPFKIFRVHDEFYSNTIITGNRESICLELLKRRIMGNNKVENVIIGNSRSQAFKTDMWSQHIEVDKNTCFHYDGSSFGLYRTYNALQYLLENNATIKNVLIVMDVEYFTEIANPREYMYIQPPEVSKENNLYYYWQFIKAGTHPVFLISYLIRQLTGKHFGFMKYYLSPKNGNHKSNNATADLYYSYDDEIRRDSVGYYLNKEKHGVFYDRVKQIRVEEATIGKEQILLLDKIASSLQKKSISVKIVIAPLYNQIKLNPQDLQQLKNLFGSNNVYDFSGINKYTSDIGNFYESSHFRPAVAKEIMKEVYKN